MKKQSISAIAIVTICFASGCATTGTNGVVKIGPDMYMVGGLGGVTDHSSSAVKARFYQDASKYCADMGREMSPVNSTGRDAGYATYASAEIQFRCLQPAAPIVSK